MSPVYHADDHRIEVGVEVLVLCNFLQKHLVLVRKQPHLVETRRLFVTLLEVSVLLVPCLFVRKESAGQRAAYCCVMLYIGSRSSTAFV